MKKPLLTAAFPLALVGLLAGAGRFAVAQTGVPSLLFRPAAIMALAGGEWNLRDDENRLVYNPELERAMEEAAIQAAYHQAFYKEAPTFHQILDLLRSKLGRIFWGLAGLAGSALREAVANFGTRRSESVHQARASGPDRAPPSAARCQRPFPLRATSVLPLVLRC